MTIGLEFPRRKRCKDLISPSMVKRGTIGRRQLEVSDHVGSEKLSYENAEQDLRNIMTKIEAIIQNSRLEAVKSALQEIGVEGMTVLEVRGHGRQKGHTEVYRGREYSVDLIPKTKIEMVLPDTLVEKAEQAICERGSHRKDRRRKDLSFACR